ncbi:hypothetical protein [Rhodococcus koreensis]|uniref:hypothetical protein n=1 Tax=Rhodococcus koreensis TaxID=99653 RepID=UPI00197DC8F4|nr:hypothetical protein [Rhodococcus koreensis]QSE86751.1 hypothetical protein JWS14_47735 [Rhodococcus koreensis]
MTITIRDVRAIYGRGDGTVAMFPYMIGTQADPRGVGAGRNPPRQNTSLAGTPLKETHHVAAPRGAGFYQQDPAS